MNKFDAATYAKQYRLKNKDKIAAYHRAYYQKNRKGVIARNLENYRKNKPARAAYIRHKHKTDIQFRLANNLRHRLNHVIKGNQKHGSAVRDLGCSIPELKAHLEGQFKDGMTWSNYGYSGWHLDHVIPLTFFDLNDPEQFLQAVHYTNLQPMWAKENISKGGINRQKTVTKITYEYQ